MVTTNYLLMLGVGTVFALLLALANHAAHAYLATPESWQRDIPGRFGPPDYRYAELDDAGFWEFASLRNYLYHAGGGLLSCGAWASGTGTASSLPSPRSAASSARSPSRPCFACDLPEFAQRKGDPAAGGVGWVRAKPVTQQLQAIQCWVTRYALTQPTRYEVPIEAANISELPRPGIVMPHSLLRQKYSSCPSLSAFHA